MLNRFSLRLLAIFPIIFCIMWVPPGLAAEAEQAFIEVLGTTNLTMPAGKTGEEQVNLEVPVRLLKPGPGITLQTISATLGTGTLLNPSVFNFTLEPQGDQGLGTIKAKINRQQTDKTGEYSVTVLAWLQDKTSPGPTGIQPPPGPQPKPESQKLAFKFTKPAAKLQLAPKKIERVITFPWLHSRLYPDTMLLSETGGDSKVTPYDRDWQSELSLADGQGLPGRLLVSDLQAIDPWKQKPAKVALEGTLPLGTAKGTITIRAPELATNQSDFSVDVVSRVSLGWLVTFLSFSILAGWCFRDYLEKRQEQKKALIAAEEQRGLLLGLIEKTVDAELKRQLKEELDKLVTAIGQKADKPEDLTKAADEARQKIEGILKDAATKRTNLETDIKKVLVALDAPEQAPGVDREIKEASAWLKARQSDLQAGYIKAVEEALEKEKPNWLTKIRHSLQAWLDQVGTALGKVRPWPENDFDQQFKTFEDSVAPTKDKIKEINDFEKLGNFLRTTDDIWWQLSSNLFKRRNEEIRRQATAILRDLEKLYPDHDAFSLVGLKEAVAQYGDLLQDKNSPDNLPVLVEAEGKVWGALKEVLGKAYYLEKIDKVPGLEQGKFIEAFDNLKAKRLGKEGPAEAAAAPGLAPIQRSASPKLSREVPRSVPEVIWLISIKEPKEAVAGELVTLELSVVTPSGQPTPNLMVRWSVVGEPLLGLHGEAGNLAWKFTPHRPGTMIVQAEAVSLETGKRQTAQVSLEVMPPRGLPVVAKLKKQLRKVEMIETAISGLIISTIGYAIFRVTFVGTFDDFLAAGLWGFTVDIGIAKVREYAAPLLTLKPKLPAGK